jgi:hypothetical protein
MSEGMSDRLDSLRASVTGCQTVAFADLSAELVLSVSAVRRQPQEDLDALCALVSDLLDGTAARSAARVLAGPVDLVVALAPGQSLAVLRSAADPVEALACVGTEAMDPAEMVAAARRTLAGIGALG